MERWSHVPTAVLFVCFFLFKKKTDYFIFVAQAELELLILLLREKAVALGMDPGQGMLGTCCTHCTSSGLGG